MCSKRTPMHLLRIENTVYPGWSVIALFLWLGGSAVALPPNVHDRHVFFENATGDESYFHSRASVIAPSELEVHDGRMPVEREFFYSPPNSLRLKWKSGPGGEWRVTIRAPMRTVRHGQFLGDTVALMCYSPQGLRPDEAPRIFLQDVTHAGVTTIPLLIKAEVLPAKKWIQ